MRPKKTITTALVLTLVVATAAVAATTIYRNDFNNRSKFAQVDKLAGGKNCKRSREGKKLGVRATRGDVRCVFGLPVYGERKKPDHEIQVVAALTKETPKGIVGDGFVGVALRAKGNRGYELRVYPEDRRWELIRRPGGEGFPRAGTDKGAIRKFARSNKLFLRVTGDRLTAKVNGEKLVDSVKDGNPLGEVSGNQAALVFGNDRKTSKDTFGWFDTVRIGVPTP